jgi:hypothetical protein
LTAFRVLRSLRSNIALVGEVIVDALLVSLLWVYAADSDFDTFWVIFAGAATAVLLFAITRHIRRSRSRCDRV